MNRIKELYSKYKLIFNCCILAVLFSFNCFFYEGAYFVYPVLLILLMISDLKDGLSLILFCIPFVCLSMPIGIYMYFACIVLYEIKFHYIAYFIDKKEPSKALLIVTGLFVAYSLLPIGDYNINLIIKLCAVLTIVSLFTLFTRYPNDLRLRFNIRVLSYGLLVSAVYSLFFFVSPYLRSIFAYYNLSETIIRFPALFANINTLAMVCEITLSVLTYFIVRKQATAVDTISFVILSIMGLATISKTFIILYGIMVLILLVHCFKENPFKTLLCLTVAAFLVLCLVVMKTDFVIKYSKRFISDDFFTASLADKLSYMTTGRYDLWVDMLRYIGDNPHILLIGAGLGGDKVSIESPHNFFITALYNFGIIGLIIFVALFAVLFRNIKKQGISVGGAIVIPFIIMGLMCMVEDFFLYIR